MGVKDENYIVVQGWMINRLKLTGNELLIFALIYGFTQDGESRFTGTLRYICDILGCTKNTAMKTLSSLIEKEFLIKETQNIQNIIFNNYRTNPNCTTISKFDMGVSKNDMGGISKNDMGISKFAPNISNINNTLNNIIIRKENFKKLIFEFENQYDNKMLTAFYEYWSESNQGGTKFKKEMQETWDLERRLKTWSQNNAKFGTNKAISERMPDQTIDITQFGKESDTNELNTNWK